ncbi:zinc ribbon domain-containing protein [bacterium]|nr:zinc ribbon domain-containing protein [bacterium]
MVRHNTSVRVFVCTTFLIVLQTTLWSQESKPDYQSMPPKSGERCIICDVPLTDGDTVLMVRGRRVPLKAAMVDSFMNSQEKYFADLQPKSALFQENLDVPRGAVQGGISLRWFLFGSYVLLALVSAAVSGYAAVSKGLPAIHNFFIGLLLSVFGMIYVLTRPPLAKKGSIPPGMTKVPDTHAPQRCPNCGQSNHPTASLCAYCGQDLTPSYESEISRAS